MNANQNTCKIRWAYLMPIAALVIGLTACDSATDSGTSTSTSAAAREMPTGSATGVLMMNAPISGISYAVSSGASGTTNDEGTFDFTYGDTIEFKIGGLTLGNI
ncbi:MAG: adhesin, partial [Nitrosomonas sp.]|nr:adhesin [Nitrosomonas sp.]